jgi:hypothetical protein
MILYLATNVHPRRGDTSAGRRVFVLMVNYPFLMGAFIFGVKGDFRFNAHLASRRCQDDKNNALACQVEQEQFNSK